MDLLLKNRKEIGIPQQNPFIFAVPGCLTCLRPWPILAEMAKTFNCKNLTTTKLRKYLATSVQVLDLKEQEQDWLARHLGHDIRVHREYYRRHDKAIEETRIAKVLHLSEEGQLQSQVGKSMARVTYAQISAMLNETADMQERPGPSSQVDEHEASSPINCEEITQKEHVPVKKRKVKPEKWEKVLKYFEPIIEARKVPGQKQCLRYINDEKSRLDWKSVKYVV